MKKYFINVLYENFEGYLKGFDTLEEARADGENYLNSLTPEEKKKVVCAYVEHVKATEDGQPEYFSEPDEGVIELEVN